MKIEKKRKKYFFFKNIKNWSWVSQRMFETIREVRRGISDQSLYIYDVASGSHTAKIAKKKLYWEN